MATLDPVTFPHGHVETAGVIGATVPMVAGIIASPSAGGAGLIVAIVFSAMVAASAGSARGQMTPPNGGPAPTAPTGFDYAGLKGLGPAPLLRTIAGMVVLVAIVGFFSAITQAWWLGVGAAPLGVRICVIYARRWRPAELQPAEARDSSRP
jgi:hypothetical protein